MLRDRNTILSLVTDQGERLEDSVAIEAEILGYYQRLLGTNFAEKRDGAITKKVPQLMREGLICQVTDYEIWKVLKSIKRDMMVITLLSF